MTDFVVLTTDDDVVRIHQKLLAFRERDPISDYDLVPVRHFNAPIKTAYPYALIRYFRQPEPFISEEEQ